MEMPDINLAHTDLNKYNQAPNYLANQVTIHHIAIYKRERVRERDNVAFQENHSKYLNKTQKIYIFYNFP